jgi:hypothetical protein
MKKALLLFTVLVPVFAFGNPPTPESIERLMEVTDVKKMISAMHAQVTGVATELMDGAVKGKVLSAADRRTIETERERILQDFFREMSWEKMKAAYIPLYQEKFTQEEVDGMLAFYESPSGQAYMKKMSGVVESARMLMRQQLVPVMKTIQVTAQETAARVGARP